MTDTAPTYPGSTEWIRTTTLQALHDETGRLLGSGMPAESTVRTREDSGERLIVARPKPTAVDLLRQVAEHAPYKTVRPDDLVEMLAAGSVGDYDTVALTRGQVVAALNAAPLLIQLVDAQSQYGAAGLTVDAIVAELRGDR